MTNYAPSAAGQFRAFSAGRHPEGPVDPLAIEFLQQSRIRHGSTISGATALPRPPSPARRRRPDEHPGMWIARFDRQMPALSVTEVTRIAIDAAREQSATLQVVGVTPGGEGNYTEVIVNIAGCRTEPCRFSVGVFRDAPEVDVHQQIAGQLRRHIREHER
jgi:hypothetical protein